MRDTLGNKFGLAIAPAAILDNASATGIAIDTLGYGNGRLNVFFLVGASDVDAAAMSLEECDTSGGSYAAIAATAASGTTGDGRLPQDDDDNKVFMISIPITPSRLRFIKPVFTAGNGTLGTFVAAMYELSNGAIDASTSTTRGLGGQIIVE